MTPAALEQEVVTVPSLTSEPARVLIIGTDREFARHAAASLDSSVTLWSAATATGASVVNSETPLDDVDVVLADFEHLDVPITELMRAVRDRCPSGIRVVLADESSEPPPISVLNSAHQVLARNATCPLLVPAISRTLRLRGMLAAEEMEAAVGGIDLLPMLPHVYLEFVRAAQTEGVDLHLLAGIIEQDIALSAKVLQLVNSACFGLRSRVTTLGHAVSVLGIEMVSALVTSTTAFSALTDRANVRFAESVWIHSRQVGDLAERLVRARTRDKNILAETMQASLLHDVGKLVIRHSMPRSAKIIDDLVRFADANDLKAEYAIIGGTHAEIGAYLLSLWGLPESTVQSVLTHHDARMAADGGCECSLAVAVANVLVPADGDYTPEAVVARADAAQLREHFDGTEVDEWIRLAVELMAE